jgi:hypothetical protein
MFKSNCSTDVCKHVPLTMKEILLIISKLKKGSSNKVLSVTYGLGETTVYGIRNNNKNTIIFVSR